MNLNILAALAILIAVVALLGWAVGPSIMTAWISKTISMKIPTAISIVTQGVASILSGRRTITARRASLVLSLVTLAISHGSLMLRFSAMVIDGSTHDAKTLDAVYHVPSVATASALMFLAVGVLLYQFRSRFTWPIILSQFCALLIGTFAIVGQVLKLPELYGYVSEYSGGVALPTGVCLVLLGLHGIAIVSRGTFLVTR